MCALCAVCVCDVPQVVCPHIGAVGAGGQQHDPLLGVVPEVAGAAGVGEAAGQLALPALD